MPTYRLKYLPKNDVLAKLSELEISWIERWVDFNCDLASMMTMPMITTPAFMALMLKERKKEWLKEWLKKS